MMKQQLLSILKYFPFVICLVLIICYLGFSEEITIQTILDYTPDNLLVAALEKMLKKQSENSFFSCFFLRTLCFLPGDAVSICLGAIKSPFHTYLLSSTLGSLPSTILASLFGASITEPTSPMFWISIVLMALYSGIALLIYKKRKPLCNFLIS